MPPLGAAACVGLLVALGVALRARSMTVLLAATGAAAAIAPLVSDGVPPLPEVSLRVAALALATWLAVRLAARSAARLTPPLLGGTAEAMFVVATAVMVLAATGSLAPAIERPAGVAVVIALLDGPALAAALGTAVAAIVLLGFAREPVRAVAGAASAIVAGDLLAAALLVHDPVRAVAGSLAAATALVAGAYAAAAAAREAVPTAAASER